MLKFLARIVFRKFGLQRILGRRKYIMFVPSILAALFFTWVTCWWLAELVSKALLPPRPPDQNLDHFRRNRSLAHYLDQIQVLIEPSSTPCASVDEVPVIILVTSAPLRLEQREAIRQTWAKFQPTYFVLGLSGDNVDDDQLVDSYIEAKQYGDMVVFDFHDHYQNLTLKTALMLRWTLDRCPQVKFMFKTDDDVMVNPWMMQQVLKDNEDAELLGYSFNDTYLHRDEYNKWYLPRWLHAEDLISRYLSGTGYLINGEYLGIILNEAIKTPLVNMEDVYFTYLVASKGLGLTVTHDRRLNPHKPWLTFSCGYWSLASVHSLSPQEMVEAFNKIEGLSRENDADKMCWLFDKYFGGDWLLY